MENKVRKISKFLSLVLRHRPELINLNLDDQGWTDTAELLEKCKMKGHHIDLDTLEFVVNNNDKKRFAFNDDQSKIRANQGHSIEIKLGYEAIQPPEFLYHGTATRFLSSIQKEGLKKRSRHHVHLSKEFTTAKAVGTRHGKPIILTIRSKEMQEAGFEFFCSENNVWLTDHIPSKYIDFP